MNEDDSEAAEVQIVSSTTEILTPEKTCVGEMDDDTSNNPSICVDHNQSNDSVIVNNTHNRTDSRLNSTVNSNPSTSRKSKRRSGAKKHRAGRNRKRKWKPYHKLTWEEQQKLDDRNARRAQRTRDQMSAIGLPLAPYNTSQFLIDDYLRCHDEIALPRLEDDLKSNHSEDSSHENYHINGQPHHISTDDTFDEQAFLEDYELVHQEYLNNLTQFELAEEHVNLEDKVEELDKQLKELQEQRETLVVDTPHTEEEMEKIEVFRIEIEKLFQENEELEAQNEKLRKILNNDS